ncbi:hypothetical protein EON63_13725 [archaeon]|nr:MAG: hypothetical protein EON63_13725 [archaeon]
MERMVSRVWYGYEMYDIIHTIPILIYPYTHAHIHTGLAIYADGTKEEKAAAPVVAAEEGGESFGGHADSMPRGHRSVGRLRCVVYGVWCMVLILLVTYCLVSDVWVIGV